MINKIKTHEFHFVLERDKLEYLGCISNILVKSVSKTIVQIFDMMCPFMEKNHFKTREKQSKYRKLDESEVQHSHIHVYLPKHAYNQVKQLHFDLNVYSMAQIIRRLIDSFIHGCKKYGVNVFLKYLANICSKWNKKKKEYKKNKKIVKQLSYLNYEKNYCTIVYSKDYQLKSIQIIE